MNLRAAWIAIAILAISASGQTSKQQRQPVPSPEEIIRMVESQASKEDDLENLWKALHISPKLRTIWTNRTDVGTEELSCWMGCDATIVNTQPSLLKTGRNTLVRVCGRGGTECRFLLLQEKQRGWTLVDYFDSTYNRYERPSAAVVWSGERRWIVVSEGGGGGTGVSLRASSWYELRNGRFRCVLDVSEKGHDLNFHPARTFSTQFLRYERVGGKELLRFKFNAAFEDYPEKKALWKESWNVTYTRVGEQPTFRFDSGSSDIDERAAKDLFHFDSLRLANFVRIAFNHLMEIARNPSDDRREWLKGFLEENRNVRQLNAVRTAFAGFKK